MRLRVCALACALTMLGSIGASGPASAAPRHNVGLTIGAEPNPILAEEGVVIYGRLSGPDRAGQLIRLYHRLDGSGEGFTRIGTTRTDQLGFYEFTRAEGVVVTNRDWFVRGPAGTHSRTVHERVGALVSLAASNTSSDTNQPIVFTGHVTPSHAFGRVFLQQQMGSSDDWKTLRSGRLDAGSNYSISYRWRRPGVHDLRVLFRGDERNVRSFSDPLTVNIQQAQVPGFTISSSDPIADFGNPVTISGILDLAGTNTPEPNTVVQLWGRHPDEAGFTVLGDTITNGDGSYSFRQTGLTTNTVYYVAAMKLPHTPPRHTAHLYQGVRSAVTMQANASNATTGQTVTFTGTVLPDKAGHVVYLQKLGKDRDWHTVQTGIVRSNSTFQFTWTIGSPGAHTFRARITSDENNVGSASDPPVTVTATAPSAPSLPTAS